MSRAWEARLLAVLDGDGLPGADPDGVRLARMLVGRLRADRVLQSDAGAAALYARDPAAFTAAFRRYEREVPPAAFHPAEEGRLWRAWRAAAVPDPGPAPDGAPPAVRRRG